MGRPARVLLALALGLLVCHAALLADWVIDDAGISFAYARNLANGAGFVSQPGAEPVEGFSNPLWTLSLVPFFRAGVFDPVWTPKLLGLTLVGLAFLLIARSAPREGTEAWLAGAAPVFLALSAPFVVWTTSGLENPLLAFLLALSASTAFRLCSDSSLRPALVGGFVGGLASLTRPEGVVYLGAFAFLIVFLSERPATLRRLGAFTFAAGGVVTPYLVFRRLYFHDWVPNTFHAKVRLSLLSSDPGRLLELFASATGRLAPLVAALLAFALLAGLRHRSPHEGRCLVISIYLGTAAALYLLLPADWMGEYRFATAFFLFLFWLIGLALVTVFRTLRDRGWRAALAVPVAAMMLLAEDTRVNADRSLDFALAPTVPFARIAEFGRAYDKLAAALPSGHGSLLLPDLGGTLFATTRLRLVDLAGLCDKTVARTLMDDAQAFHDYVFDDVRPKFIHVHGSWAGWAALHQDSRLARDYLPLYETWVGGQAGEPAAGDYVRRDAAAGVPGIEFLRSEFVSLGLHKPLP
jgi:hypothetical protein